MPPLIIVAATPFSIVVTYTLSKGVLAQRKPVKKDTQGPLIRDTTGRRLAKARPQLFTMTLFTLPLVRGIHHDDRRPVKALGKVDIGNAATAELFSRAPSYLCKLGPPPPHIRRTIPLFI